jgi:hypothetical protein
MKINNLKSRCVDKIEKRSYITLSNISLSKNALANPLNFISNGGGILSLSTSNSSLSEIDSNDLNFIINEDLVRDNR